MGGCSPLTVHFRNTSLASSSAVYKWDFGNGNTSTLKDPGAVFLDTQKYTVTLTVTDGNQTSSTTETITVYKKPVVDFSSSLQKVCTPEATVFTAKATADQGTVTSYLWDFGDGYTQQTSAPGVSHSYVTAGEPQVRLSVTDNHGCTNSKTINNIIKVFNGVKADFEADKTFICFQPDPVQMVNKSEGEGPLQYSWDFGDSVSSSEKDPTHVFAKNGNYTVGLAIENSNGCKDSLVKSSYLNVGNFTSQLNVPEKICKNAPFEIRNTSTPAPSSFVILVDGTQVFADYYGKFMYTINTAGEHTIQLTNKFGGCEQTITKKVAIKELLQPGGFIADITQECKAPVTVNFTDTTTGAVKSEWNFEQTYYPLPIQGSGKKVSCNFQANNWNVTLFVTDSNGCRNSVQQAVNIRIPYVYIQSIDNNPTTGCDSLTKKLKAFTDEEITSLKWDFGNGNISTETEPTHTFTPNSNGVVLTYITAKGCTAQAWYNGITVYPKVKADFVSESGTDICGNAMVWFKSTFDYTFGWDAWYVDGKFAGSSYYNRFNYQFTDTGKHTITQIVYNGGGCRDTLTRVDYIHVKPSFPKITDVINTCDGDRATVIFKHGSKYAESGIWDFGDGSTAPFNKDETAITHHYAATGDYKVILTTSNGSCTNRDSIFNVPVVTKSNILLSSVDTNICQQNGLSYSLSNFSQQGFIWGPSFYVYGYQYDDGTTLLLGNKSYDFENWITRPIYNSIIKNVEKGKDSVRIITSTEMFTPTTPFHRICLDTTNFVPIKVTGSVAGFEVISKEGCFQMPFSFKDTSTSTNTTIISRVWNFGDGQTLITTKPGVVSHTYQEPGTYYVSLTITDAGGCTSTDFVGHMVTASGPKANFTIVSTTFHLNTAVQFYNTTSEFNGGNIQYQWDFGDGSTSSEFSPVHVFSKPGSFTISLIAKSLTTGCADTISRQITVRNFNAYFSFTSSFVDHIDCSSLLVRFVNTSYDYSHIKWDFGDGFTSDNVNTPSHVYEKPGKYIVKLFVTGYNGLEKTYLDSVYVRDNKVNISADMVRTCTAQSVTLSALSENAASYIWDFGDGTLAQASDTFSVHYYKTPGNYVPKLIAKDADGCASSVVLTNKISIDSLNVTLKSIPQICAPKEVQFNPVITNKGSGEGPQPLLTYHWNFGTANQKDTANIERPTFVYDNPGTYKVTLEIQSPAGCKKQAEMQITALQGLGGEIKGPSDICEQSVAQFSGNTLIPGQPSWKWIFADGSVVNEQTPPEKKYDKPGNYLVKLVVDNSGCADTVSHLLQVHGKPEATLSAGEAILCEGSSVSVTASGGTRYAWYPSEGLNSNDQPVVSASPVNNTNYVVTVTNDFGCTNHATFSVNVIHPFILQLAKEAEVCSGKTIQLQAAGAQSYQWIDNTEGLSNTSVANPVASAATTMRYTVVGTGEHQCFTDTAMIKVTVKPTPVVYLGRDTTICEGQSLHLKSYTNLASYLWQDGSTAADYLVQKPGKYILSVDLNQCSASDTINVMQKAIPWFTLGTDSAICSGQELVLKPNLNTNASLLWQDGSTGPELVITHDGIYQLKATNECGSHSETIRITERSCNILMPNAFTPNGDGINDVFRVKYPFPVSNFHFLITNRWGQTVFETNNIHEGWDGRFKSEPPLAGIYVWVISFTDFNNRSQQLKGTVNLLK